MSLYAATPVSEGDKKAKASVTSDPKFDIVKGYLLGKQLLFLESSRSQTSATVKKSLDKTLALVKSNPRLPIQMTMSEAEEFLRKPFILKIPRLQETMTMSEYEEFVHRPLLGRLDEIVQAYQEPEGSTERFIQISLPLLLKFGIQKGYSKLGDPEQHKLLVERLQRTTSSDSSAQ